MRITTWQIAVGSLSLLTFGLAARADSPDLSPRELRHFYNDSVRYTDAIEFPQLFVGNPVHGQAVFGVSADDQHIDLSQALFQGNSIMAGPIVSNGRGCSSCHRPESFLKLPTDLSGIPANDPLFTGESADGQGDPRLDPLLRTHGLVKYRHNRFNPVLDETDPFRKWLVWRKTQTVINFAFAYGVLTDGHARHGVEQARAAAMSHTQQGDARFDDLVNPSLNDIVAYQQTEIQPPELADLLNNGPLFGVLSTNPFYTVHTSNDLERDGQDVFQDKCMSCHNMPNVFSNRDHVNGPPANFPPIYGHTFDIGVAQRNKFNLDFRFYDSTTQTFSPIVMPLTREDGEVVNITIVDDIGAAGTSGRYEDLHKFRVPTMRNLLKVAPYFHDNSAATLEEVVDYFNSDTYNDSLDGRTHPIRMNDHERDALVAFLKIL
jgi:cytochrome c peroxidase